MIRACRDPTLPPAMLLVASRFTCLMITCVMCMHLDRSLTELKYSTAVLRRFLTTRATPDYCGIWRTRMTLQVCSLVQRKASPRPYRHLPRLLELSHGDFESMSDFL